MSHKVIAELSVVPIGVGTSLSKHVAACLLALDAEKKVSYELTAMGTIIHGPLDVILDLVKRLHEVPFDAGAKRVVTTVKIDDRRDKEATMESKVASVMQKKRSPRQGAS